METRCGLVRVAIMCLALGLVLGLGAAIASENGTKSADTKALVTNNDAASQPEASAGMVVAIDKESGQLRAPTSAEAKQIDDAWDKFVKLEYGDRSTGFTRISSADGSHGLKLGPAFAEFDMVSVGADGKLRFGSASSTEEAIQWMKANAPSTQDDSR